MFGINQVNVWRNWNEERDYKKKSEKVKALLLLFVISESQLDKIAVYYKCLVSTQSMFDLGRRYSDVFNEYPVIVYTYFHKDVHYIKTSGKWISYKTNLLRKLHKKIDGFAFVNIWPWIGLKFTSCYKVINSLCPPNVHCKQTFTNLCPVKDLIKTQSVWLLFQTVDKIVQWHFVTRKLRSRIMPP